MFILIHHKIHQPEQFWETAWSSVSHLPHHIKLHSIMPNHDGTTATCLWEAPRLRELREFLDQHVGELNQIEMYQVDTAKTYGAFPHSPE